MTITPVWLAEFGRNGAQIFFYYEQKLQQQLIYNSNNDKDIQQSSGIYSVSEQRKARTKTIIIKLILSRNIHSLCNTTHSNERYVPIIGYRRQLHKNKY